MSQDTPNGRLLFPPGRDAGLARLAELVPRVLDYAHHRNFVVPPHSGVSRLSPYIRHRLVLEREAVASVWAAHPRAAVAKYVSEVLWRTYWKGWLEQRPQVWARYLDQVAVDLEGLSGDAAGRYAAALEGRTGIDCLDAWARELKATGYLHNHARMWFASIWIFTLDLPWTLGAAFFLRHLLDGDPASNTLSWRWVAGLHTQGKHYLARADNIARYTRGRFHPQGELNEQARPRTEAPLDLEPRLIAAPRRPHRSAPSGLLLTPEDLAPERSALVGLPIVGLAGGWDLAAARRLGLSSSVQAFSRSALEDGLGRAMARFRVPVERLDEHDWLASAEAWACGLGVRQVVTLETPVGVWRERLERLRERLTPRGIGLASHRRGWDAALWPAASRGFFPFREYALAGGRLDALLAPEEEMP